MASTWQHPEFGEFTHDGYRWKATLRLPAFAAFGYVSGFGDVGPADGTCELAVAADETPDGQPVPPAAEVLALVSKVLAEQARLAPAVVAALWDDFNGRGPMSGMWWHGALDEVTDDVDPELPPLTGPDALYAWLRLTSIEGLPGDRYGRPLVKLCFDAPFEEEHGVGVLTDGVAIVGTGYAGDAGPYPR